MKIPCEIVVMYILPMIRRELAIELVTVHHKTQAEVARRFGLTDAAVSQYVRKKRGDSVDDDIVMKYPDFTEAVRKSAALLAEDKALYEGEICRLCNVVKNVGLLAEVYERHVGEPLPTCSNFGTSAGINERC